MFQRRWTEEAAFRVLAVIDCFHQKSKLPTEIFPFRHHGEETGWGLSFLAAAGGQVDAEVIAFEIRSDVEVAEMRRAVVRDGVCWRRHRSQEHHLPFRFRRARDYSVAVVALRLRLRGCCQAKREFENLKFERS